MTGSYKIYVKGRIGPEIDHLLADLHPDLRMDTTVLTTDDFDQAALHGTLARLRNLGLHIDAIWKMDADNEDH